MWEKMKYSLAIGLLALPGFAVLPAAAGSACVDIEGEKERLRCYDAENRTGPNAKPVVIEPSAVKQEPSAVKQEPSAVKQPSAVKADVVEATRTAATQAKTPVATTAPKNADGRKQKKKKTKKAKKRNVYDHMVVRITTSGVDKRLVYELDNGERWIQTKTQIVTIRKDDTVAIRSSLTGRKSIKTPGGATAWVRRLP